MSALNPKRRRFVAEYLKDQNGTQAAIRAGYSRKTANEQAAQLLANLSVKTAVDDGLRKIESKSEVTVERIRTALLAMAEADPLEAFEPDGTMKKLKDIPKAVRMLLSGIEHDGIHAELVKLRFSDRVRVWELLGKHIRMFTDIHEVTGRRGAPVQVRNIDLSGIDEKTLLKIAGMDAAA